MRNVNIFTEVSESRESGSIMIEVLVGLILLSIMALGMTRSTLLSMRTRGHAVRTTTALQIASDTIEDYSSRSPSTLSDSDDLTDVVTRQGMDFDRTIDITVNSDTSVQIDVTVSGTTSLGGNSEITVVVLPWEVE